jgi:hypothetical protein
MSRKRTKITHANSENPPSQVPVYSTHNSNASAGLGPLLRALSTTIPPESFHSLVLNYLCPALEALPPGHLFNITRIVHEAHAATVAASLPMEDLELPTRKKSLEDSLKELIKDCKRDWKDGYDRQSEMMDEIAIELRSWLPVIWRVGAEFCSQVSDSHKALMVCARVYEEARDVDSRYAYVYHLFNRLNVLSF